MYIREVLRRMRTRDGFRFIVTCHFQLFLHYALDMQGVAVMPPNGEGGGQFPYNFKERHKWYVVET